MEKLKDDICALLESFLAESRRPGDISAPLVSPWAVKRMGELVNVNVVEEFYQVPNIKTFLRTFILQYRINDSLSVEEVDSCLAMVRQERAKYKESAQLQTPLPESDIGALASRPLFCIECGLAANRYCVQCRDCMCSECCDRMHRKGNRSKHYINQILNCCLCMTVPAKLQCTYSFNLFCPDCYSKKHVMTIPTNLLDLRPLRIDYTLSPTRLKNQSKPIEKQMTKLLEWSSGETLAESEVNDEEEHARLSRDWHPFMDSSGVRYYCNFKTQESMRRATSGINESSSFAQTNVRDVDRAVKAILFENSSRVIKGALTREQEALLAEELHGAAADKI